MRIFKRDSNTPALPVSWLEASPARRASLNDWLLLMRSPFLIITPVICFLGTSIAWWHSGGFNLGYAMLATTGIIFAHVSANVFNEYFDFKSGIDFETNKTPFNGGSGVLPGGLISSRQALWLALGCLTLAIPIGIFFVINSGPGLLPVLGISLFCIVFYTPMITRIGWPEWSPGLAFGFLPVMAFYFIQTGHFAMPAFVIAVPLGILGHNLLLINEIPDVEADRKAGRRTLPITLGKKRAALVYASLVIIMYLWIIGWIAAGEIPFFGIFCLLSLPFAVKAISVYKCYNNPRKLAGAQAANVALFLSVTFILGAAYVGSGAFSNNGMFR